MRLTPIVPMTLEQAIAYIEEDELVEVTPQSIRMRKTANSIPNAAQARSRGLQRANSSAATIRAFLRRCGPPSFWAAR